MFSCVRYYRLGVRVPPTGQSRIPNGQKYSPVRILTRLPVIYTDFCKAFDSIDFGILLKKLQGIGFHVNLIDWLLSYLCKRSLYVYFNNAVSHEFTSTSGVPQGSNLGPLIFIIFINDLTCVFKYSGCLLFADDLKLFGSIRSDLDSVVLQRDLDCLFKWHIDNRLHLNIEKCSVLSYTRKAQPLIHVYKINNLVLSRSNTITDLGIIFDSKLDFSQHIDTMVSKTYRRLGFLKRRTREFSSELTLKVLYCAHIRSNLEYCSIIWNPNYRNKIEIIERIQNNFLRYLLYEKNGFYLHDISSSLLQRNKFCKTLKRQNGNKIIRAGSEFAKREKKRTKREEKSAHFEAQAEAADYHAQKIAYSTHAHGDQNLTSMRLYRPTDSQPFDGVGPNFYTDLHS
ncbi:hypothetical protein AVEN_189562-1 [Araneus ventricosus]|uniref:Reverse transcriptase domain-containing protein n=1 Tax=Araneus ventricosus TaxID=182803 RepID=A0A4Y2PR26_ARAVE|nr:hypothetical protein AVEN_189562-1 [Araneus ventricosus]